MADHCDGAQTKTIIIQQKIFHFLYITVVLGVHYDLYKSSYNIS
jgi:hypothetical protein